MCQVYYFSIPCRSNLCSIKLQSTFAKFNPEDTLVLRKGVCQYHTLIMIDCLRSIGMTAGYVCSLICTHLQRGSQFQMEEMPHILG